MMRYTKGTNTEVEENGQTPNTQATHKEEIAQIKQSLEEIELYFRGCGLLGTIINSGIPWAVRMIAVVAWLF